MGRLIDEDDVIREIEKHKNHVKEGYVSRGVDDHGAVELYFLAHDHIKELIAVKVPPAQPDIIRCKDCEYYHPYYCEVWSKFGTIQTRENGYCYMAERREE